MEYIIIYYLTLQVTYIYARYGIFDNHIYIYIIYICLYSTLPTLHNLYLYILSIYSSSQARSVAEYSVRRKWALWSAGISTLIHRYLEYLHACVHTCIERNAPESITGMVFQHPGGRAGGPPTAPRCSKMQ